jgi:hypothetical protein
MHLGRDYNCVGVREGLQAWSQVRCLADRRVFLARSVANKIANNDYTRGYTDPRLQGHIRRGFQCAYDPEDGEAGAHCPLGIVLVRSGIPKIRNYAVAKIICDHATKMLDLCCTGRKKGADDVALFFLVELGRKRSRTDHVAEHDRDLPALGRACWRYLCS